nr:hypothetical protein [Tanacetum cinerariifolium]
MRFALEALRFVFKDLTFCLRSTAFCLLPRSCVLSQKSCVLSSKILRFVSVALRFVRNNLSLSQNDLQGSRTESGFKRAFATLSGQDIETFTGIMFLNVEQLKKQLDKEDFQEIGSMNDEYVEMTRNYFIQYTQQAILKFGDTLIQHLESVKKSIDERAQLKREYDSWVNERQMQTMEEKIDTSKALDASSVDTECSRTESKEHDTSSRPGNDAHDDDADIRPSPIEIVLVILMGRKTGRSDLVSNHLSEDLSFSKEGKTD